MFSHASMNRSYALAWNDKQQAYVPAPENARARGKRGGKTVIAAAVALLTASGGAHALDVNALPTGGQVTHGQASVMQSGNTMQVNQGSDRAALNWQSFNVGSQAQVNFVQPSSSSVALNRVVGQDPTQILGKLNANGQVFIVNPNGVLFAPGAQVSAAGVVASTRDISNADFAAGHFRFSGQGTAGVTNQGTLTTGEGGYVALIGGHVSNEGKILAPRGDVRLAAADKVTLHLENGGLTGLTVEQGTLDALAQNKGLIQADGGRIYLTADAADAVSRAVVNNEGVLEAHAVSNEGGVIKLMGDTAQAQVQVGGTVDVSSADSGKGGQVVATGKDVTVAEGARIDARGAAGGGEVLLGGGWQGQDVRVANASTVDFKGSAQVDASATGTGNGGTVVLWSQNYTGFHGAIGADGGTLGGNGGQVETSSHGVLNVDGQVHAQARTSQGTAGAWLLDPSNVTIAASGASGTGYAATYNPTADSTILANSIVNSLYGSNGFDGTDVTITTGTGGSAGDITVAAPIAVLHSTPRTLTFTAANNINVNAAISSTNTALNVVLNPDSDNSSAGDVNFGVSGSVSTNGGNFYIGSTSSNGSLDTVTKQGQDVTMAAGSFIDVGGSSYAGMLDIKVNGTVSLSVNSLRNTQGSSTNYNQGNPNNPGAFVNIDASTISSSNTDPETADITTNRNSTLIGETIGSTINPIKISGGASQGSGILTVSNIVGNSYIREIGEQSFYQVNLTVGSQLNSTQDIQIDRGQSQTQQHVLLNTDGAGLLNLATGDILTVGDALDSPVRATNVVINAPAITFADNAIDTGTASLTLNATTMAGVAVANNVADIHSSSVTINGHDIGTSTNALELASNDTEGSLNVNNSGGSTFLKSVNDFYTSISMTHVKDVGTHSMLFSGGDHIDFVTDGNVLYVPTITGSPSDGSTFGATIGVDLSRRLRSLTIRALTGDVIFGDNSVDLNSGTFSTVIDHGNTTGVIAAENNYNGGAPVAQITAGDVSFSAENDPTPTVSTIGGGGKDIQIAKGTNAGADTTLTVSTQQGDVNIHELTQNHFKTVNLTLNQGSLAQTVAIDLAGPDDINFADVGSNTPITLDATKVNVSGNNRNFSLSTPLRDVQIDGMAQTAGSYNVYSGQLLKLNTNFITSGGSITLQGAAGIDLLTNITIDSNSDRVGDAGNVSLYAGSNTNSISAVGGNHTLTVNTSSSDGVGGGVNLGSSMDNRAGDYLGAVSVDARGFDSSNDGTVTLGGPVYRVNGSFGVIGKTVFGYTGSAVLIDTEQGNVGSAGAISFTGGDVQSNLTNYLLTLDASTTAGGGNGGNVALWTDNISGNGFDTSGLNVNASAGAGGTKGDIILQAISTTRLSGPVTQTYNGNNVTLTGDLRTAGGNVDITGNVAITENTTIDTNELDIGNSGGVTVTGSSISSVYSGRNLTIDTHSGNGNGGNVILPIFTANAGSYINDLSIDTTRGSGSHGTLTLNSVTTDGAQNYTGGAASFVDALSTNGGDIDVSGLTGVTLTGNPFTIDTDRAGGTNAAGRINTGNVAMNGSGALTIDTTADGGGAKSDVLLGNVGSGTAFASVTLKGANVTTGQVRAVGDILMEAQGASSDVTLNGGVSTTNNGNITIAAGRNFTNNVTNGLTPNGSGRYFIYSSNPANTLENMSGYNKHYNEVYVAGNTPGYAGSGNWFFYTIAPVVSVASGVPTITYGDADPSINLSGSNYSGFIDGDTLSGFSGSQTITPSAPGATSTGGYRPVGTYAYTLNGTLTDNLGYQYAVYSENLTVNPRNVSVTGVNVTTKAYDGNNTAAFTGGSVAAGLMSGDLVTVDSTGVSGTFSDKNAATGKTVTASGYAITGTDSSNYTVVQPTGLTGDITPKTLAVTGSTASDKTYDRNTTATVNVGTLSGFVGSETVTATGAGTFADRNAGTGKNVTASYTLSNGTNGGLASNYQLSNETLQATIQQKTATVTATGVDRVYDGTQNTTATLASTDIISGDTVNFTGTAQFIDKNVGVSKTVNITGIGSVSSDALNYSYNTTASTTATITPKTLSITGTTAASKTYDGSNLATVTPGTLSGFVGSETVSTTGAGTFADKDVGINKNVTVAYTLADGTNGGLASNYNLAGETVQASIAQKAITVNAVASNKVYDGTTTASATLSTLGLALGDTVVFTGTAAFADKNAGTGKTVNVTGVNSVSVDASNYSFSTTTSTTADITPKALNIVGSTANTKIYDGNTTAGITTGTLSGFVGSETVTATGVGTFDDKNVGTGKNVAVNYTLGNGTNGGLASNYNLTGETLLGDVQAKAITVVATGTDKVYDGTLGITAGLDSSGIVSGDSVSFAGSATLLDKNVGTGKTVAVTGISASGVDAGNYSYGTTASTTANVTPKPLTVEATGVNKTYDGTTTASVTLDSAGIVSGDQVGFSGVAAYGDKNVGTGKAVNVSGIASNGSDAFNYTVSNTTATTTATVERLGIQVTATGVDKVYDGALNTPVLLASGDIVSGDQVDITGLGLLADKNVGTGKPVTVSDLALGGADGGNYSLILTTVSTTTNVTPRPISVALIGAVGKTDTGSATVNLSFDNYAISNLVAGETLLLQGQGTFTDTSVGTGKNVATTVNLGDYIALESDTLPSNYALFTGPLSAPIGEVMASSNYQAALQSLPSIPTGDRLAIAGHEATTLLGGGGLLSEEGNTVSTANGEDKKKEDHVGDHSNRTRDISLRRRNLALSQGGIRLPSGLAQDQ